MVNNKLKKIMTDLAAGHITKKQAELLINPKKTHQNGLKQRKKASKHKDQLKKN